jgi:glutamate carboxypeptidase
MEQMKERVISLSEHYAREQLDFVIDICNQNSYSYHKKGVDRVAEMIIGALGGILPQHEIRKQGQPGDHHLLRTSPAAQTSARAIYLVGHMDTVFPPDHPFQECRLQEDLLNGPGTGDMKGGLAVFVYALKILSDLDLLDRLKLVLILNSDEEIGSISSRSVFLEEREKAMICLVAECAGLQNEIVVSRNGKMAALVKSLGQGSHVGRSASGKSSALLEMAHKIIELESLNGCLPGVSINVGKITAGGLGVSTVPGEASFLTDIRWEHEAHKEALLSKIETILAAPSHPGCRSEFEIVNSRPAMPASNNPNDELVRMIRRVGRSLGQEITLEHRRGTSDANFFGSSGVPTLDGLGPISDKDHTPEEFIRVSSLKERTALVTLFLLEYGRHIGMIAKES